MDWKRNLNIVLTTEWYKYILTEEHPNLPTANAPRLERERYEKWVKADEITCCYILALTPLVLQYQLKDYLSATNMILNLKEMFWKQGRPAR